jgi:serine protease Do
MPQKVKYIFVALALMSLILGTFGCSISFPQSLTPPQSTPPQHSDSAEHTNPNWTFPSEAGSATVSLPDFPPVIAKVMPSVVSVTTEIVVTNFFGQQYTQSAAGSGVIIDNEGYIVTNNHVVQDARNIQVELHDGRTFSAEIVGTDALTDLAVLKINATSLPYIPWGDSSQLALGVWVIAIGNALGEGISASEGIISRLDVSINVEGNTLRGLVQTTAAINPGNSGGPLVNLAGKVIGITSAKIATVGVEGMGYAISSNSAKPIIEDLIHQRYVIRPWLGVELYPVDPFVASKYNLSVNRGALITKVFPQSPAARAGLKEGDVIIHFEDKEIANANDLVLAIHSCQIGQEVEIAFVRGEDTKTTLVKLEQSPRTWG